MAQHDVAGALFTSLHRHQKIEGRQELKPVEMQGTGSVRQAPAVVAQRSAQRHVCAARSDAMHKCTYVAMVSTPSACMATQATHVLAAQSKGLRAAPPLLPSPLAETRAT